MLTPPEVRAVYVVDTDGALVGVVTRKTLVARVVAGGLDPGATELRRLAEAPYYTMDADTPLDTMRRHLDALLERLGEDGVALGSDFDGATIPDAIGSAAGLPALLDHLSKAGYGDALLERIAYRNWLSVLGRTWKS